MIKCMNKIYRYMLPIICYLAVTGIESSKTKEVDLLIHQDRIQYSKKQRGRQVLRQADTCITISQNTDRNYQTEQGKMQTLSALYEQQATEINLSALSFFFSISLVTSPNRFILAVLFCK